MLNAYNVLVSEISALVYIILFYILVISVCYFTTILYVTSVLNVKSNSGKSASPPKVIVCGPGRKLVAFSNAQ